MDEFDLAKIPSWVIHDAMNSVWGHMDVTSKEYKQMYNHFRKELVKRAKHNINVLN